MFGYASPLIHLGLILKFDLMIPSVLDPLKISQNFISIPSIVKELLQKTLSLNPGMARVSIILIFIFESIRLLLDHSSYSQQQIF